LGFSPSEAWASGTFSLSSGGVAGGSNINNVYFNGRFNQVANLTSVIIQPCGVLDVAFSTTTDANSIYGAAITDGSAASSELIIAGARGTGTGIGGDIIFKTAPAGATGNTQNALVSRFRIKSDGNAVIGKTSGLGIQVDTATPTFGYRDLLGEVKILSPGANDPTLAVFRDSVRQFSFSNAITNEVYLSFHIPHDYVASTDIFIHAHWGQNVVDTGGPAGVPGDVKWQFEVTYAKGHDQAAFPATFTTTITQSASGTQYQHMLAEIQLSATAPSATQIDSDIIEPDGVILVRCFRDPTDGADTLDQVPFLHFVDVHYQTSNIGTKQKSPDFYT